MADVFEPITLEDIGFTMTYPETSPEEYFKDFITTKTLFVELPQKFNDAMTFGVNYFTELFESNTEEILNKANELYNKQLEQMKADLTESLGLNSEDLYDIHVTNANLAQNSLKFNDKTYNDMITDIMIKKCSNWALNRSLC